MGVQQWKVAQNQQVPNPSYLPFQAGDAQTEKKLFQE